ncbi:serine hydrolase domain-containing protein [Nonomuraea sediminis]|uniref:serine hydrolase domain-containing protein n=1 Tax=Nonomuraea sediminis TaxID=2835864 RepID=UPI001BDC386B|nr:serine hydrolase domain-containing protein [Nonomuraea sediminis]
MDRMIQQLAASLGVVGAQVAVARGDTVRSYATGLANAELGTPVTDDTLFQIGSTTKVHTAALVMLLGIDLDAPVLGAITPRHLMSMTSGLDNGPYVDVATVADYVDLLADIPPIHEPGAGFGYTNASTVVSGLLVEQRTGRSWDEALRDLLLVPAGLTHTASVADDLLYHRVAVGHAGGEPVRPFFFSRGLGPAGSTLCASATDLVAFGRLFLRGGGGVLPPAAVEQMLTPQVDVPARCFADHWCLGPYLKIWDGVRVYGHSGTTPSGSSTLLWVPEHDLAVATVVNVADRGYPFADAVIREVMRSELGIAKPPLPTPDPATPFSPELYVGTYESHDSRYEVTGADGRLHVRLPSVETDLLPLGEHRFLPADDAFTGNHMWDLAFVIGPDGRAVRLLNGAFAARRAASPSR